MSKFSELLLAGLLPVIKGVEVAYMVEVLQDFHDKDEQHYEATIKSVYIGLGQLKEITDKTKTKFDNIAVDGILEAIIQSATDNDVTLPE